MNNLSIVDFRRGHQPAFESLNRTWIERYFTMEPSDIAVLTNPEEEIIAPGGAILMAELGDVIVGTVGLRKIDDTTFEFTKMAVDENYRRRGIAEQLSYASFLKAKALGADKIILFSNSQLKGAIQLYEKIGFTHLPVADSYYLRSDVKMVIDAEEAADAARNYFTQQQIVIQ